MGVESEVGVDGTIFWTIVFGVRVAVGGGMVSTVSVDFTSTVIWAVWLAFGSAVLLEQAVSNKIPRTLTISLHMQVIIQAYSMGIQTRQGCQNKCNAL